MFEMKISGATPAEFVARLDEVRAFMTSTAPAAIAAGAAGAAAAPAAETPAEPKRTRKNKDNAEPAPAAAADQPLPTSTSEEPAAAADAPAATYADVQAAVTKLAAAKGRAAVIEVFEQFGVDHGSKLTETQWPEAIATLTGKLEG